MTDILNLIFQNTHPIFSLIWECVVTFLWNTEAACPVLITTDTDEVRAPHPAGPGRPHRVPAARARVPDGAPAPPLPPRRRQASGRHPAPLSHPGPGSWGENQHLQCYSPSPRVAFFFFGSAHCPSMWQWNPRALWASLSLQRSELLIFHPYIEGISVPCQLQDTAVCFHSSLPPPIAAASALCTLWSGPSALWPWLLLWPPSPLL